MCVYPKIAAITIGFTFFVLFFVWGILSNLFDTESCRTVSLLHFDALRHDVTPWPLVLAWLDEMRSSSVKPASLFALKVENLSLEIEEFLHPK